MSEQRRCQGVVCGGALLPPNRGTKPRKWCSDRCRKITLYSRRCVDCGRPCNVDGRMTDAAERCGSCNVVHLAAASHAEREVWTRRAIEMRAEGKTNREIALEVGRDYKTIAQALSRMRRDGVDVPRDPYHESRREYLRSRR